MSLAQREKGEDSSMEMWKPVIWRGHDMAGRYEVSNLGRVRSKTKTPKILKPSFGVKGYLQLCVTSATGRRVTVKVHRLVTEAFIGPLKDGKTVNHIDANKCNNALTNLEIIGNKENCRHAYRNIESRNAIWLDGCRMSLAEALDLYGDKSVSYARAYARIRRHGWNVRRAISTPPMKTGAPRGCVQQK